MEGGLSLGTPKIVPPEEIAEKTRVEFTAGGARVELPWPKIRAKTWGGCKDTFEKAA